MKSANRLQKLFERKKEGILNIYVTAGYPHMEDTVEIVQSCAAAGADIVELGMPYSDPLADGETIQESSRRALNNGLRLDDIFNMVRTIRRSCEVPIILMGYVNQLMQYGEQRFIDACTKSGVDGLIIPDMPADIYEAEYKQLFDTAGLGFSFLVTPETSSERIAYLSRLSSAFLYVVSSSAVTGGTGDISSRQIAWFNRVHAAAPDQVKLIGFGISDKESFDTACAYAQGAIIGSAFIRVLGTEGKAGAAPFIQKVLFG
ncbi:MAG: tryptophan synthase subunit alpha [Fibrobacterota bacterium]